MSHQPPDTSVPVESLVPIRLIVPIGLAIIVMTTLSTVDMIVSLSTGLWVAIHLVTVVVAGLIGLGFKQLLLSRGTATVKLSLIIAVGAVMGVAKALLTASAEVLLGLTETWTENLPLRLLGATIAGAWVLTFTAFADKSLRRLEKARNELVESNVATQLRTAHKIPLLALSEPRQEVKALSEGIRRERKLPTPLEIKAIVDKTIRPMSVALWAAEDARYPAITAQSLLAASLGSRTLPAGSIALLWGATSFTALAIPYGIVPSIVHTVAIGIIAYVTWRLVAKVLPQNIATAIATILAISLGVVLGGALLATILAPALELTLRPANIVLGAVWMTLAVTGFSVFSGARKVSQLVRHDLESQQTRDLVEERVGRTIAEHSAREIATQLHGEIQSKLLGVAAGIEHKTLSPSQAARELDTVATAIERLESKRGIRLAEKADASASQKLTNLIAAWGGIMSVDFTEDSRHHLEEIVPHSPEIIEIIREGLTNAYRHGQATSVSIRCKREEGSITLVLQDDGYGPRKGSPGLGHHLIDQWSSGRWELVAGPDSGSVLRVELAGSR